MKQHKMIYKYKVVSDKTYQNLGEWKADYNGGPFIPVEYGLIASQYLSFNAEEQTVTRELIFASEEAKLSYKDRPGTPFGSDDPTLIRTREIPWTIDD